jgi:hypothetical protein
MKKVVALAALVAMLLTAVPLPAHANGAVDAALALGAFAVFNQLFLAPFYWGRAWADPAYVTSPPVVYSTSAPMYAAAPATYYPPAPPAIQREVLYPHGRYILYGDGVSSAYQWVWLPNPSSLPPPGAVPPPGSAPPTR